jgi:uncharacterized membrane protein
MASDEELGDVRGQLAELAQRLTAIEQRLGIRWTPETAPGALPEEVRPSPGASRHPLPGGEGTAGVPPVQSTPLTTPLPVLPPQSRPLATPPPIPPPQSTSSAPPPHTLETQIGAHWLNRVGIAAVLFGAAFFLKYAFDNNWIGPSMRVAIGAAVGIALLGWAEGMRARGHELFAHSLDVLGSGILYLTIWAASETYTIISSGTAFGAMIVVTAIVVGLALRHRSQFLAGVALTGGFMTPVLLSTGGDHEVALFTYVGLLDLAAVVLIVLHPWLRALAVAFFGTLMLYVGWYSGHYTSAVMTRTIGFATLFFLLFAVVPLLRRWGSANANHDAGIDPTSGVLVLPFFNAIVYFAQLSAMIWASSPSRLAWYAVAIAALFVVIAGAMRLRGVEREDLAAAHLALALGFVTIAIPLKLNELWITIGWLAEAAALLAIAPRLAKARASVFRFLGSLALGMGVFRLLFIDKFSPHALLLNWRALTYAMAIAIFAGIAHRNRDQLWRFVVTTGNALALIELTMEASDYFNHWQGTQVLRHSLARDFTWSALWMLYGTALMAIGFRRHLPFLRWLALFLLGVTIAKVFLYDMNELERVYRIVSFIGLGVLLLAISFAYQRKWISMDEG